LDLSRYTGKQIAEQIKDNGRRDAFLTNWEHMAANYGEGVDAQLLREQILLTDETADTLYRVPSPCRYRHGSRPELESTAKALTTHLQSETEQALTLMRFCRDLYKKRKGLHLFYGGTEEELIEKGEELCECLARLFTALAETIGLPARIITHTIGGHLTAEVYADGKWGYLDPRCGVYFRMADGRLASLWELYQNPALLEGQSPETKADVSDRFPYEMRIEKLRKLYLSPTEVNTIKYYSLADSHRYHYTWYSDSDCLNAGLNEVSARYADCRKDLMNFGDGRIPRKVIFTLPDGCVLHENIPLGVRCEGAVIPPEKAEFHLDGTLLYQTDGTVTVPDIHNRVSGMIMLGGASGVLPVDTIPNGIHQITATLWISKTATVSGTISIQIDKRRTQHE